MNWQKFREEYGESPEEHFDDPADYQDSIGNKYYANQIRKKREEEMEVTCCDLCREREELKEAIGWYTADNGKDYDVCEQHAIEAKIVSFDIVLY